MAWDRTKGKPEPTHALDRIPEHENGEPLVDLRAVAPKVRILREATIPWCRKSVAERVAQANAGLPEGCSIGITDAWRPLARQQRIYDFMWESAKVAFPGRSHASLRRTVNRWVAPTYRKAPPGHCTGAALDVNLLDSNGEPIDVFAPFDRFKAAPTYTLGLTEEALRHRMMLVDAMLSVGFSNCRDEWWHYSYGDAGWAVRLGKPECFYGIAHLDPKEYLKQEEVAIDAMKERTNPFLT